MTKYYIMIEYYYIGDYIENDIFKNTVRKLKIKNFFDQKYQKNLKFTRREECAYAIVSMDFPPELIQIYIFINEKFPIIKTKYENKGERREEMRKQNIRYTLSANKEFIRAKIGIGQKEKQELVKNVWILIDNKNFY